MYSVISLLVLSFKQAPDDCFIKYNNKSIEDTLILQLVLVESSESAGMVVWERV